MSRVSTKHDVQIENQQIQRLGHVADRQLCVVGAKTSQDDGWLSAARHLAYGVQQDLWFARWFGAHRSSEHVKRAESPERYQTRTHSRLFNLFLTSKTFSSPLQGPTPRTRKTTKPEKEPITTTTRQQRRHRPPRRRRNAVPNERPAHVASSLRIRPRSTLNWTRSRSAILLLLSWTLQSANWVAPIAWSTICCRPSTRRSSTAWCSHSGMPALTNRWRSTPAMSTLPVKWQAAGPARSAYLAKVYYDRSCARTRSTRRASSLCCKS